VGVLDHDLRKAALAALRIERPACREFALTQSWTAVTDDFIRLQQPVRKIGERTFCPV
jgi:hypothetical protein